MAVVVSDTSPIRALADLSVLDLLQELFGQVLIPPAVASELRRAPAGQPAVDVRRLAFVRVRAPWDQRRVEQFLQSLDLGESEALALALEVRAEAILIR